MSWNILLYESKRGEKPVDEFIKSCDPQTIAKITHLLDLLESHGPSLGMPHAKRLSAGLYELRIRGGQEIRILYAFKGRNSYLLNALKRRLKKHLKKKSILPSKGVLS